MKVIAHTKNHRTGEIVPVSWGNDMTTDLSVISTVAGILEQQRARENGELHPAITDRFSITSITIEL